MEERLKEISEKTHQKLDVVKRYYEKNGLIPEVKAGILSNKTLNLLLEKAEITYSIRRLCTESEKMISMRVREESV